MQVPYDLVQERNLIGQWPPDPTGVKRKEDVSEVA